MRLSLIHILSLPELMKESDVVSLHTPSNASTRGLIGRELIGLMKPTALLINCARGPIAVSYTHLDVYKRQLYVFESHVDTLGALALEIFHFVLARVVSLFADQAIIWLLVKKLGWYDMLCKLISNVVVVIMNYVFSKLVIFRKK